MDDSIKSILAREAAGGQVVNLPGGEIPPALQSGAIDATEWVGPYNDLAFGLYKVTKFYYYPGWHEPATLLDNFVNLKLWESLDSELKDIITTANAFANSFVLSEFIANNNQALDTLINQHGVTLKKFPDEVLNGLGALAGAVIGSSASREAILSVDGAYPFPAEHVWQLAIYWSALLAVVYVAARSSVRRVGYRLRDTLLSTSDPVEEDTERLKQEEELAKFLGLDRGYIAELQSAFSVLSPIAGAVASYLVPSV